MQVSSNSLGDTASTIKTIKRIASATLLVSGFCFSVGIIANMLHSTSASGEVEINAIVTTGSISITTSNTAPCTSFTTSNSTLAIDVTGGNVASDCIAVSVSTDSLHGYTASISGPTTGNLTTSNNLTIGSTAGTMAAPTTFASQTTGGAWGFAIPSGQIHGFTSAFDSTYTVQHSATNTSRFAAVPTNIAPFSHTTQANTSPNVYHVFFAVAAGPTLTSGFYSGQVTFSANINATPPPLIFIQDITHQNCPANRTMVTDARDNRTYWIQRMPDGRCWMQTNLAYGGGGNNTFGDVVNLTQGTQSNATIPLFAIPTGANPTEFPNTPSTSTDGGVTSPQFGYLYNWCAAMGNQPAACQATATQPNQSISVCPAGWRLPTGEQNTGEFTLLNNAINGGLTDTDAGLLTNGLFQYSGTFGGGSFFAQGDFGSYWSSTRFDPFEARALQFFQDESNPDNWFMVDGGTAVRCVAKELPEAQDGDLMQEIGESIRCPRNRTMLVDARDNRTYWARRIGNLCWMETNLAYAGGGNNAFGDTMTLNQNISPTATLQPNFGIPAGANPTTYPDAPSTATDGGVNATTRQYGYMYNWCAAMGNQPAACQTTAATQPNQSVNDGTNVWNVCPRGWRLPIGSEFLDLNRGVNNNSGGTDIGLRENWLGMRGGNWGGGIWAAVGTTGTYWSSTVVSTGNARRFTFTAISVNNQDLNSVIKESGGAVRCVRG